LGDSRRSSNNDDELARISSRHSSLASVSFRPPRNPSLPQGHQRKTDAKRLRNSSPSPVRYVLHVPFEPIYTESLQEPRPLDQCHTLLS
jgi:hypothetical protein